MMTNWQFAKNIKRLGDMNIYSIRILHMLANNKALDKEQMHMLAQEALTELEASAKAMHK